MDIQSYMDEYHQDSDYHILGYQAKQEAKKSIAMYMRYLFIADPVGRAVEEVRYVSQKVLYC